MQVSHIVYVIEYSVHVGCVLVHALVRVIMCILVWIHVYTCMCSSANSCGCIANSRDTMAASGVSLLFSLVLLAVLLI